MSGDPDSSPLDTLKPLIRVRQIREFTAEAISQAALDAILEVARWSGSSRNTQPWRFIAIQDAETLRAIAEAGQPQTRSLVTATSAIAITVPDDARQAVSFAYDEGRVAERILVAASLLGLGAGIAWVRSDVREPIGRILDLSDGLLVRTIVALGHPTEAARAPKSAPGQARLPRAELVCRERWRE